jgi:uncharacterized damage-inducible protein DinB
MTWTAPDVERRTPINYSDPASGNDPEHEALLSWLAMYRDTLLWKCAGLTADQLRQRSCAPSTLSLLGLVRHMTDVERTWFRMRIVGEDLQWQYWTDESPDADFDDVDSADAEADFDRYRAEIAAVESLTVGRDLNEIIAYKNKLGEPLKRDLRWILIHMVEEYSRHLGHADLLRERIDGATGY